MLLMYNDQSKTYHIPVLLEESINALNIKPDGVYVDVTFGGGGHSKPILHRMNAKGRLFGFDQDKQALANAIDDPRCTLVQSNFQYIAQFMRYYGIESVDGILADLGVSSFHFDEASRGFSYRFDTELDMRMNNMAELKASDILEKYDQLTLQKIFSEYGELRNAKTFSQLIVDTRAAQKIRKVSHLLNLIDRVYRGDKLKYTSQVFQALRIEVNDELGTLKTFLKKAWQLLSPGGRLVVITYHSLEDRVVKEVVKKELGGETFDEFGRKKELLRLITRKPIVPQEEEKIKNSRAASAKLRVIEKIE